MAAHLIISSLKYPCANFVSQGSCGKGDACLFSHQARAEEVSTPSGNTNSSMQVNNRGCNPVQQNHFSNSTATHSLLNRESSKLQQASSSLNKVDYSKVYSHGDRSHSKSVQGIEKAFDNSLTSTVTPSSMLLVSPSFSNQSLALSSGQRAMISSLGLQLSMNQILK
ncbi:hypothetical protein RIF29_14509 [Crotalaria pallida]|uniref:C3H1-type domain-containing protein n=1 Tax=Crotalaria pallida TaxID=3830 RepID=A0AAN9ICT7_CROPI